jgi:hypothetical protein
MSKEEDPYDYVMRKANEKQYILLPTPCKLLHLLLLPLYLYDLFDPDKQPSCYR